VVSGSCSEDVVVSLFVDERVGQGIDSVRKRLAICEQAIGSRASEAVVAGMTTWQQRPPCRTRNTYLGRNFVEYVQTDLV